MSTPLLQLNHYFGIRQQPLRRVLIYAPTLIWVQQGRKQLWDLYRIESFVDATPADFEPVREAFTKVGLPVK